MRLDDPATIHHPELHAQAEVPASTVASWTAVGWVEGPFPFADSPPPKSGRGSGFDVWLDYATKRDIIVDIGATREDIIAAVEAVDVQQIESRPDDGSEDSPVGEAPTALEEDQS